MAGIEIKGKDKLKYCDVRIFICWFLHQALAFFHTNQIKYVSTLEFSKRIAQNFLRKNNTTKHLILDQNLFGCIFFIDFRGIRP